MTRIQSSQLFDQSVDLIREAYDRLGHTLGWTFLGSPKETMSSKSEILLLTTNPGGRSFGAREEFASSEKGSVYLIGEWRNQGPGKSSLQIQVRKLFEGLASHGAGRSGKDLLNNSLAGYFVPFRSPRLTDLPRRQESFQFGKELWSGFLAHCRPRLIICIDRKTCKSVREILSNQIGLQSSRSQRFETGWGAGTAKPIAADLHEFVGEWNVRLLRLPHLSTFKLFSSEKCVDRMNALLDATASGIGKTT